ncbi:MAG: hypothetical protein Q8Q80_03860 [Methyloversatilis sp.]|uniref:hypothetical protein n=1 Tax=Methyloversatilis sp. TaxID=2569862 RepID=UPI002736C11F|nr:hypothetical protein [Methyloversatilis sp.]MDP3871776.1 hypothetical protein [Methyloversatilis sp.]
MASPHGFLENAIRLSRLDDFLSYGRGMVRVMTVATRLLHISLTLCILSGQVNGIGDIETLL